MNQKNTLTNKKGFTLVELLLVILIIVIIGIILIPNVLESLNESRVENGKSIEKLLLKNLELYNTDHDKDLWNTLSDNYGCKNVQISDLLEQNPDIKLGECLLNNDTDSLTIEKIGANKYRYYAGISCGKKLLADNENKYILSSSNQEDTEIYYKTENHSCNSPITITADPNKGEITDANGWIMNGNKAQLTLTPGEEYNRLPKLNNSEHNGYICDGWNTDKDGNGEKVDENTVATFDIQTIYARCKNASETSELVFENQTIEKYYSQDPQTSEITKISGEGSYTFEGVGEHEYLSVSSIASNRYVILIKAATPVGTYKYSIKATDINTKQTKTAEYTIIINESIKKLVVPTSPQSKVYTGYDQLSGIECPAGSLPTSNSESKAKNAGIYYEICRLTDTKKYRWVDGTTGNKKISWEITKAPCPAPTNLRVSTAGIVSWNDSNGNPTYQMSTDNTNWFTVTNQYNYLDKLTQETGNRNIYVKATCNNPNYEGTSSSVSTQAKVYKINFDSNNNSAGTVSPSTYNVIEGATFEHSNNKLIIKGITTGANTKTLQTITASPKTTHHTFANWSKSNGTFTSEETIIAKFNIKQYTASVNVLNGTLYGSEQSSKKADYNTNITFQLQPTAEQAAATVTCTNDQTGSVVSKTGNANISELTVNNISSDTTCTVRFSTHQTTLYKDGTLIINEQAKNRNINLENHGSEIVKEYDILSYSNVYLFDVESSQLWKEERTKITSVELGESIKPTNTKYWFYGLTNMQKCSLTDLDASDVIDMEKMFYNAGYNANNFELDLSNWNTSKVTNMNQMFQEAGYNANNFEINLSSWNTSQVTNMSQMFQKAGYNANDFELNISSWNTSKVTNMSQMFQEAGYKSKNWSIGELNNWNTSQVTTMSSMFYQAGHSATTFNLGNLSNWNVLNVTTTGSMFYQAGHNATTWNIGNLSNWFKPVGTTTPKINNMPSMFQEAGINATTWNIGDLSNWDVSKVTGMASLFNKAGYSAANFSLGNLNNWNTSKVTSMMNMFQEAGFKATTWNIGDLSNWNTSNVKFISGMFNRTGYKCNNFSLGNLNNWDVSKVTSMKDMFNQAGHDSTTWNIGNLSNWDVSKVTTMESMFEQTGYSSATWNIGNLSNWDVSKVTTMKGMFDQAGHSAGSFVLDLSNWFKTDTDPQIKNMSSMFSNAGQVATTWNIGNISNWDVSKVTTMNSMFNGIAHRATTISLNLSNWNTSQVMDMGSMFQEVGSSSSTFDIGTLKVYATNINQMFQNTSRVNATLNIYSNPTNYDNAFNGTATFTGSLITVNHSSITTNIDEIIETKSNNNVVKGSQLD